MPILKVSKFRLVMKIQKGVFNMGLDFKGLPKELQTKLAPYFTVGGAKSVEEAIQKHQKKVYYLDLCASCHT